MPCASVTGALTASSHHKGDHKDSSCAMITSTKIMRYSKKERSAKHVLHVTSVARAIKRLLLQSVLTKCRRFRKDIIGHT
jgi:hypothetical protein